ncbi:MAG: hypothetical protein ACLQPD_21550 [Desulfomonilaceae bacterium]
MAGDKFLNPILKAALCSIGTVTMGYLVIAQIGAGGPYDHLAFARVLVLLGFLYLLAQSIRQILQRRENSTIKTDRIEQ